MLTSLQTCSRAYWHSATQEMRTLRRIVFAALIAALTIVISSLYIPVAENLRIYFKYLVTSVGCAVYGPVMGMLVCAVTDTLGYLLFPSGAYFPGYLLSEMLGGLIYGLLLYRKRITVFRLASARLLVNVLVNILLNSLWSAILYSKGYYFYLGKSILKNLALLPVEVLAMTFIFSLLLPQLSRMNALVPHDQTKRAIIPWI